MIKSTKPYKPTKNSKLVFILSILTAVFILVGWLTNVYSNKFWGAVFELLWLPAIIATIVLPLVSIFNLIKAPFIFRSLYLYATVVLVMAALIVIWFY